LPSEAEAAKDVHANTTIGDRPEGAIDAKVTRIANEDLRNFEGLGTAETISGASTSGTNQAKELEV
jgi:hypothetical protein